MSASELGELFPRDSNSGRTFALLKNNGRIRLALPRAGMPAAAALELYPAQRPAARFARGVLRWIARAGLPLPLPRATVHLPDNDAFVRFLHQSAGGWFSDIAIFAGNPNAPGRRWLCLLFASGKPIAVVKAGTTPEARGLIRHEQAFLTNHRPAHAPAPRGDFNSDRILAFALPFVSEHPDQTLPPGSMIGITNDWFRTEPPSPLADRPAFHALMAHAQGADESRALATLGTARAVRTLTHGDFAPWNVKRERTTGEWRVLDWERGDPDGVPGWDILHFIIQPLVLVRRAAAPAIADQLDAFLNGALWKSWAERSGLAGFGPQLAWSYLLHSARVQQQSEGAATIATLLSLFTARCAA